MNKKILAIFIFGMFLFSLASVSALTLNSKKSIDTKGGSYNLSGTIIQYNSLWIKYAPIEIKKLLGLGKILFSGAIIQHTNLCDKDCLSVIEIYLAEEGALIDDITFKTLQKDNTWIEQDIRKYQLEYWGNINDYKTTCTFGKESISVNGTNETPKTCSQSLIKSYNGWINYQVGSIVSAGKYTVRLSGEKKPGRTVDWIIETLGKTLDSWAVWGNISLGATAEVTLNNPIDNATTFFPSVLFNASANVTNGARITNISLFTNETGTFEVRNTTIFISGSDLTVSITIPTNADLSRTPDSGMRLDTNQTIFLTELFKVPTSTATTVYIKTDFEGTIVGSGTFVGDQAIFSTPITLNTSTLYYLSFDAGGAGYLPIFSSSTSALPNDTGFINFISGFNHLNDTNFRSWNLQNISFRTVLGDTFVTENWTRTISEDIIWNVEACDTDGDCGLAPSNFTLFVDTNPPTIEIEAPTGTFNSLIQNQNISLNFTAIDDNLEICTLEYNNTNTTVACINGTKAITGFDYQVGFNNLTMYANDSFGNIISNFTSWNALITEISSEFNGSSFVTSTESYLLRFNSTGSTITNGKLYYEGIPTSGTIASNSDGTFNVSATKTLSAANLGVNEFIFEVEIDGTPANSSGRNQTVAGIVLENCEAGNATSYLHTIFQDEGNQSALNASISSATFEFWLGDGSVTQTLLFTNITENPSYDFCFFPANKTLTLDIDFPYASTNYPQRIFRQDDVLLTNATTNSTLFLLNVNDGIFTRYQAINSLTGAAIEAVDVTVQKLINAILTTVAQGITDATGTVTFFLNFEDLHSYTFIKTDFAVTQFDIRPSSPDTYPILMVPSGAEANFPGADIYNNLTYTISPGNLSLPENEFQDFTFTAARIPDFNTMRMAILSNESTLFNQSITGSGTITTSINTSSNESLSGIFTITTTNESIVIYKTWTVSGIYEGNFSLQAVLKVPSEIGLTNLLWWNIFRYVFIFIILIGVTGVFYYLDPFDSSSAALYAIVVIIWLFGTFGWLTIDTPGSTLIDNTLIPSIFTILVTAFFIWRYKTQ